jgi:hypothetical protein
VSLPCVTVAEIVGTGVAVEVEPALGDGTTTGAGAAGIGGSGSVLTTSGAEESAWASPLIAAEPVPPLVAGGDEANEKLLRCTGVRRAAGGAIARVWGTVRGAVVAARVTRRAAGVVAGVEGAAVRGPAVCSPVPRLAPRAVEGTRSIGKRATGTVTFGNATRAWGGLSIARTVAVATVA